MYTVAETDAYLADAKRAGMTEEDREAVIDFVATNPQAGDLIKGSNGVRKIRIARPGMGKSGGWRVLTALIADVAPIYLIAVYAKNRRGNISKAELNALAQVMTSLKSGHRSKQKEG